MGAFFAGEGAIPEGGFFIESVDGVVVHIEVSGDGACKGIDEEFIGIESVT